MPDFRYQLLSQLPFCDVSVVYLLDCKQHTQFPDGKAEVTIRGLSAKELLEATNGRHDFGADDARRLTGVAKCLAAFIDHRLVGYLWYRDGVIPSEMNTPGDPFNGFDLQLSDSTQYLFKVFVDKKCRGLGINTHLCRELAKRLEAQGCDQLVTLTAWENVAFRRSAERMGFKSIGNCIELATQGKSIYFFAKEDASIVRYVAPDLASA